MNKRIMLLLIAPCLILQTACGDENNSNAIDEILRYQDAVCGVLASNGFNINGYKTDEKKSLKKQIKYAVDNNSILADLANFEASKIRDISDEFKENLMYSLCGPLLCSKVLEKRGASKFFNTKIKDYNDQYFYIENEGSLFTTRVYDEEYGLNLVFNVDYISNEEYTFDGYQIMNSSEERYVYTWGDASGNFIMSKKFPEETEVLFKEEGKDGRVIDDDAKTYEVFNSAKPNFDKYFDFDFKDLKNDVKEIITEKEASEARLEVFGTNREVTYGFVEENGKIIGYVANKDDKVIRIPENVQLGDMFHISDMFGNVEELVFPKNYTIERSKDGMFGLFTERVYEDNSRDAINLKKYTFDANDPYFMVDGVGVYSKDHKDLIALVGGYNEESATLEFEKSYVDADCLIKLREFNSLTLKSKIYDEFIYHTYKDEQVYNIKTLIIDAQATEDAVGVSFDEARFLEGSSIENLIINGDFTSVQLYGSNVLLKNLTLNSSKLGAKLSEDSTIKYSRNVELVIDKDIKHFEPSKFDNFTKITIEEGVHFVDLEMYEGKGFSDVDIYIPTTILDLRIYDPNDGKGQSTNIRLHFAAKEEYYKKYLSFSFESFNCTFGSAEGAIFKTVTSYFNDAPRNIVGPYTGPGEYKIFYKSAHPIELETIYVDMENNIYKENNSIMVIKRGTEGTLYYIDDLASEVVEEGYEYAATLPYSERHQVEQIYDTYGEKLRNTKSGLEFYNLVDEIDEAIHFANSPEKTRILQEIRQQYESIGPKEVRQLCEQFESAYEFASNATTKPTFDLYVEELRFIITKFELLQEYSEIAHLFSNRYMDEHPEYKIELENYLDYFLYAATIEEARTALENTKIYYENNIKPNY